VQLPGCTADTSLLMLQAFSLSASVHTMPGSLPVPAFQSSHAETHQPHPAQLSPAPHPRSARLSRPFTPPHATHGKSPAPYSRPLSPWTETHGATLQPLS